MKLLNNYYKACEELREEFLMQVNPDDVEDFYWIADEIGGTLCLHDMYVSINNIADYFALEYTPDEFIDWYWKSVNEEGANMKYYKKFNK